MIWYWSRIWPRRVQSLRCYFHLINHVILANHCRSFCCYGRLLLLCWHRSLDSSDSVLHNDLYVVSVGWIAVSIYVLVAIVRKRLGLAVSLYQTLQILSVTLFEKTPTLCALQAPDADAEFTENVNQLILFDI